jgi:DNA-binding NtrC family response regulator
VEAAQKGIVFIDEIEKLPVKEIIHLLHGMYLGKEFNRAFLNCSKFPS